MKRVTMMLVTLFMVITVNAQYYNVGTSTTTTDYLGNRVTTHRNQYGNTTGTSTTTTDYLGNQVTTHRDAYGNNLGTSTTSRDYSGNTNTTHRDSYGNTIGNDVYRNYIRVEEVVLRACSGEILGNGKCLSARGISAEEGA